ncbi:nitric oxide reductase transcriptional regulator NorR [Pseudoalteromonas sp. PS5]|uniref:nitric oxide reductase transcriptional regulator NorR n=1 Tax=Pseudoalteromonas sp. PS5 TaxID=1437473 RepID=UPI000FFEFC32|nr:nitric oxide reductase transcriptional regulator NorR [Pseudoalteromonas sp. PS5]RXF03314.1 nitric oxide reductase transcriptional regulator NorR [Pseudoalteromonas sp. PS5]
MNALELSKLLELSMALSKHVVGQDSAALKQYSKTLIFSLNQCVTADAIAVLSGDKQALTILASNGLSEDAIGRRFLLKQQPRLNAIVAADGIVSFAHDSTHPDPYDGLLLAQENRLPVHACMGFKLMLPNNILVVTFDSLRPESFQSYSDTYLNMLSNIVLYQTQRVQESITFYNQARAHTTIQPPKMEKKHALVGESVSMQTLKAEVELVASSDFNVLIQGDTGTGKELVAKHVHQLSARADKPFVQINCAALPDTIAESELFGHVKGAFTGADKDRLGKFLMADGGTLFLDEVGELSLLLQSKLLRALQSGEVQAVGADEIRVVNVRVVAATNRDLQHEIKQGKFRADLYHRLCVYPLHVPTLTERLDDIPLLVGFFLEQLRATLNVKQVVMDKLTLTKLLQHDWPGNVRELEHCISRAALKAKHQQWQADIIEIQQIDIPIKSTSEMPASLISGTPRSQHQVSMKSAVEGLQKQLIIDAMEQNQMNWSAAARQLELDRANLVRLAKRLGVDLKKQFG